MTTLVSRHRITATTWATMLALGGFLQWLVS